MNFSGVNLKQQRSKYISSFQKFFQSDYFSEYFFVLPVVCLDIPGLFDLNFILKTTQNCNKTIGSYCKQNE